MSKLTWWSFLHLLFLGIFLLENSIKKTINCSSGNNKLKLLSKHYLERIVTKDKQLKEEMEVEL